MRQGLTSRSTDHSLLARREGGCGGCLVAVRRRSRGLCGGSRLSPEVAGAHDYGGVARVDQNLRIRSILSNTCSAAAT